jgi:PAS domain S-box-containing protein
MVFASIFDAIALFMVKNFNFILSTPLTTVVDPKMTAKEPTYDDLRIENELLKKQLAEKKELQKELAKTRKLMQAAFDQSPVPMVVVTYPDFTFKIINPAMENFVAVDAAGYLNKTPFEIDINWKDFNPSGALINPAEAPLPMALKGMVTKNKESYIVRHNGTIVWGLASAAPIYDDDNQMVGAIYVATDITERKKSEQILADNEAKLKRKNEEYEKLNEELLLANEQLKLAKTKAEESDRLKTAFLQNMSHEIRTPMNAIMGFSDLLLIYADDKSKLASFTQIINQRCSDLLDIINDLLDISKIESGQLTTSLEECNLNELFAELHTFFANYQVKMDKQHIALTLDAIDHTVVTDKGKLKQVLVNLINNAFKFTEEGKIEVRYKMTPNNNLIFYVRDTGIGIPAEKHGFVFDRFTQLNQSSRKNYGGTGLGLSIVKGLVELLGGEVTLDSSVGKGSTFAFTIPNKTSMPL